MSGIERSPAPGSGGGGEGPPGPEGPKGEFNFRGAWSNATTYAKGDAVTEGGSTYASIKAANLNHKPSELGEWWALVAEKGATGAEGPKGTTGEKGTTGNTGPKGEFNFRGAWKTATPYAIGDAVTEGGSTYAAIKANESVKPPEATNWTVIAEKGEKGTTGEKGEKGEAGSGGLAPGTPEAMAAYTLGTEQEPSATKDAMVYLSFMMESKAESTVIKVTVAGVVIAEWNPRDSTAVQAASAISFIVPKGKKWKAEASVAGVIKEVKRSVQLLD